MSRAQILVVDDEPDIRRLVQEILEDENYTVATAENAEKARLAYNTRRPDLVLLDIWMPDIDGISLLKEWSMSMGRPAVPVIIMSGHGNVETAVEATRLGAYDFMEKPVSMGKLLGTVERALETEKIRHNPALNEERFEPLALLVCKSPVVSNFREALDKATTTDAYTFITGDDGSGKLAAARYLHNSSGRSNGPFIVIDFAAASLQQKLDKISTEVIAAKLLRAQKGTLLLNQISSMGWEAQSYLLHSLESQRLDADDNSNGQALDIRFIATNSESLDSAVDQGHFNKDLFARLSAIQMHIPTLYTHCEDIPDLVNYYVNSFTDNDNLPYRKFTTGALNALRNYHWPGGNLELKQLVKKVLIQNRGPEVEVAEIVQVLEQENSTLDFSKASPKAIFGIPLREARDQFEKAYLEYHLKNTGGNVSELADVAGMERTHLYRKLKQLGINPKLVKKELIKQKI